MVDQAEPPANAASRFEELGTFLFLAIVLAPLMTFLLVGTYGFVVWMSQLLLGPPSY